MADISRLNIFNFDEQNSLARKIFEKEEYVNLTEFDIPYFKIPKEFNVDTIRNMTQDNYVTKIYDVIKNVAKEINRKKFSQTDFNVTPILYEAIVNGYEYGNEQDPKKMIRVGSKVNAGSIELLVEDQGGKIRSDALAFMLRNNFGKHDLTKDKAYYDFSERPKPNNHSGIGTMTIHTHADKVFYYKNSDDGLGIYMVKKLI